MRPAIVLSCAVILVAACGGSSESSDDRVLHLGSGDMTEREFRVETRAALTQDNSESFCRSLKDLSDAEALDVIVEAQQRAGQTSTQEADADDRERGARIVKEECERIF